MLAKNVYLWDNRMIMVFDENGQQIAELQGEYTPELWRKIQEHSDDTTLFNGLNESLAWR